MAVTAKARAQTALHAQTALSPAEALAIVKQVAERVKEPGFGRKDGKFAKSEVRPRVVEDHGSWLRLEIGSGWEQAKASAVFTGTTEASDEGTMLTIGGLEKYRTLQSKFLGLIPSGPASILHFGLYKRYLGAIKAGLLEADPEAIVSIGALEL